MKKSYFSTFLTISLILILNSCALFSKKDDKINSEENKIEEQKKKKRQSYNVRERVMSDGNSGFVFGGNKKDILGGQNIMWKATLNILDFMPIVSASYDGGLIVTDWYSSGNSDESVKINISFTSNEVSASSIVVSSFKKICKNGQNCKTVKTEEDFNKKIKDQILAEVREINSKIN